MLIFLVGYMACGKSTIGRKLHKRLKWGLYDTDKEIVAGENMTIVEIFDKRGEEYFREIESQTIKKLIGSKKWGVISTGGGAPIWGDNMDVMNAAGLTVYLARSAESTASRLSAYGREKRPKLRGLSDDELVEYLAQGIAQRDPRYREAKLVMEVDNYTDDMIVDEIVNYLESK